VRGGASDEKIFMTRTACRTSILLLSLESDQCITKIYGFRKVDTEENFGARAQQFPLFGVQPAATGHVSRALVRIEVRNSPAIGTRCTLLVAESVTRSICTPHRNRDIHWHYRTTSKRKSKHRNDCMMPPTTRVNGHNTAD
jgi:hypothetical protein